MKLNLTFPALKPSFPIDEDNFRKVAICILFSIKASSNSPESFNQSIKIKRKDLRRLQAYFLYCIIFTHIVHSVSRFTVPEIMSNLPSGWSLKESKSQPGKAFYVNKYTGILSIFYFYLLLLINNFIAQERPHGLYLHHRHFQIMSKFKYYIFCENIINLEDPRVGDVIT
jgi:hypothetical protein